LAPIPGSGNGDLQIVRAYYGLNNRTNDVTQLLRGRVPNGTLVIQVNNNNMGGDPAVGGDKVLTVIYRYQGREQTSSVEEGNATGTYPWNKRLLGQGVLLLPGRPDRDVANNGHGYE
jgi:hypothetical protein